jgi:hypothetical protein
MERRKPRRYNRSDYEGTITASALRRAGQQTQLDVMREWFHANYEDPVENTPYESAEGGYIYIWGGPYEPFEELEAEFGGVVHEKLIQELADELSAITWNWTGHSEYDDVDDYLFESIAKSSEHHKSFEQSITDVEHLLNIKVTGPQQQHLLRLLYVNVITALETYLSDLFISAVGKDKSLLRQFVETLPEFKSEKIAVSYVFKAAEEIEKKARSYLIDVVWHHLNRVKPMFKDTLGLSFPENMSDLFKAVLVRHDLVHRNGKTKDGGEHDISEEIVKRLIEQTKTFVVHIDHQWTEKATAVAEGDF